MYNNEYKENYLNDSEFRNNSIKTNVNLLFRKIEPYENKLGKDLYDFSVREILNFYKSLCITSHESLLVMNNQYKIYTAHAIRDGVVKDCQNHYDEIGNVELHNCLNLVLAEDQVITREDLLFILNSSDVDNVSEKFICLALFEGLCGKECIEITQLYPENFKENNIVELPTGRKLTVTDQLVRWAMESADEYEYIHESDHNICYMSGDTRIVKRFNNSLSDEPLRLQKSLKRRIDLIKSRTGCQAIGIATLKESGRLYNIKKLMSKGKTITEACRDKDLEYRYGRIPSVPRYCIKYGLTEE